MQRSQLSRRQRIARAPIGRPIRISILAAILLGGCAGTPAAKEAPSPRQAGIQRVGGREAEALRAHEMSLSLLEAIFPSWGRPGSHAPTSSVAQELGSAAPPVQTSTVPGSPPQLEGQPELHPDRALAAAAAELASHAAQEGSAAQATDPDRIRLALTRAGSAAAQIHPLVVRATTLDAAIQRIRRSVPALLVGAETFTHVGAGAAESGPGREQTLVLLLSRSYAELEPIKPTATTGRRLAVRGRLAPSLRAPELHVISPDGRPSRIPLAVEGALPDASGPVGFQGSILLDRPGRWILEILGSGESGPVVAAVQHLYVDAEIPRGPELPPPSATKPTIAAEEERALATAINRIRAHKGLGPLLVDPLLSQVARSYAEELSASGRLAHRSERSGAVADRLRRAGYEFRAVGENLAQAASATEAQRSLEASPRHLQLLLGEQWREAGYGVALHTDPLGSRSVFLVQILAVPR